MGPLRWRVAIAACVVLGSAHAEAHPREPKFVACVGDSITFGVAASSSAASYPSNLQKLFDEHVTVGNFGHSGATMLSEGYGDAPYQNDPEFQAATDFVDGAGAGAVVDVVILLGANDSRQPNWTPAGKPKNDQQYLKDYRAMVEHFRGLASKPVVYVALPLTTGNNCSCGANCCQISPSVIHDQELPLIKQLASEMRVPVIDLNTPTIGHPEYFADGVHPNDAGYVVLANLIKMGLDREPTVSITSPSEGATVAAGLVQVRATASGGTVDIASVEFYDNAVLFGKATAMPFEMAWQAKVGSHSITPIVTDSTLATTTGAPITVTVTEPVSASGSGGIGGGGAGGLAATGGSGAVVAGGGGGQGGVPGGAGASGASGASGSGASAVAGTNPDDASSANDSDARTSSACGCFTPGRTRASGFVLPFVGLLLAVLGRRRWAVGRGRRRLRSSARELG